MYQVQHSCIIFLYEFCDFLDFRNCVRIYAQDVLRNLLIFMLKMYTETCWSLCSRCAQRCVDLNVVPFLTDFNQCWNVPFNFGTPPQYKIWQKSARSLVLSCAWTEGFFWTGGLESCTPTNWQNNDLFSISIQTYVYRQAFKRPHV